MALGPGTRLGSYEISGKLGEGGMGEVYRAHDPRLGRDVAIKVLPADMAASAGMLDRFRREARAVAALNHPNIVTIHSVEDADGVPFLTMELVEGESLDRLIPAGGLDVGRFVAIGGALAGALAAAHDKGIIHRDLKPANVMVTKSGTVKVLDFGLAKVQEPAVGEATQAELPTAMLTASGMVMGTRPYMSPEQVQGRPVDPRTDIFSLGVMLYEMATGQRPFQAPSSAELFAAILRDPAPPVSNVRPDLPADLQDLAERCLAKDPRDRPQTAHAVGDALREHARSTAGTALQPVRAASREESGTSKAAESFRVEVLPFQHTGTDAALGALAEGLRDEIITGLSRFAYLRVLTKGQSGARYVLAGSLRQAGGQVRVAVRVMDTTTGANLWAETYARSYSPDAVFEIQDSLAPPIVSTIAEMNGVLSHSMWIALRDKAPEMLTPYEAMLRSFGFYQHFTPDEYELALAGLKQAIVQAPNHSGCLAMLAIVYANGHLLGFGAEEGQADLAVVYGRRAVVAEPSNPLAHFALAEAQVSRKDIPAFRSAAERALALNPLDGGAMGGLALWMAYTGEWARGRELMERAMALNLRHQAYFWYPLVHEAYRRKDYARALELALRLNLPGQFWTHVVLAMVHGQLGNREASAEAVQALLAVYPDFAEHARQEVDKFFFADRAHAEHVIEGLRKAGLTLVDGPPSAPAIAAGSTDPGATPSGASGRGFPVAVAPFTFPGQDPGLQGMAEGLTEEIGSGLSRFSYLRVVPPGSKAGSARYLIEGSIRQAGSRLRATVRLSDTTTATQLWSTTYERTFSSEHAFDVQDDLVARTVSTVADQYGVLPRSISTLVRGTDPDRWSPDDALMFAFGYHQRLNPTDHAEARRGLEHAVEVAPRNADCRAILSLVYAHEYGHGFNPLPNPLERAMDAARRAVDLAPDNHLAHQALSTALLFRKELAACLHEAERAIALNPLDGGCNADMGANFVFAGDRDRGCALIERSMDLNPLHPAWYRGMLGVRDYLKRNYRAAIDEVVKANAPDLFWMQVLLAASCGQLGESEAASRAVRALHELMPGFGANAPAILATWFQPDDVAHFLDGLRKAGLEVPAAG